MSYFHRLTVHLIFIDDSRYFTTWAGVEFRVRFKLILYSRLFVFQCEDQMKQK